jgi:hypothetical protein
MKPRFQFRLRTLLIGVTLLAAVCRYIGSQAEIVGRRTATVQWIHSHKGSSTAGREPPFKKKPAVSIPWVRMLLGNRAISLVLLQGDTDLNDVRRVRALFPEAVVYWARWDNSRNRGTFYDFPDDSPSSD